MTTKRPTQLHRKLLPILFEDDAFLAVRKPSGIDLEALQRSDPTCLKAIVESAYANDSALVACNRLSRFESGIILFAKGENTARQIRKELKSAGTAMEFIAVVRGDLGSKSITVTADHGKSKGRKPEQKKRRVKKKSGGPKDIASKLLTTIKPIRRGEKRTLVRIQTVPQNTHSLKAQLRAAGASLLGDQRGTTTRAPNALQKTCLHLTKFTFLHPGKGHNVVLRDPSPKYFLDYVAGRHNFQAAVESALVRRIPLIRERATDAYRLLSGKPDNVPGIVAERLGDIVVLNVLDASKKTQDSLRAIGKWYLNELNVKAVYVKYAAKTPSERNKEIEGALHAEKPFLGQATAPKIRIREKSLRFIVRPYDGHSVGLFLDQRDNRWRVHDLAAGKDVLNLFAYTCGFSVAAALGGAKSTQSVDISGKSIEWGRENFELNGIDTADHTFVCADAMEHLKYAKRHQETFDIIIVDAPTFAHGKQRKRSFSIERDLSSLVASACDVLRPEGILLVSTNFRRMRQRGLVDRVREGIGKRKHRVLSQPKLPIDFAVDPDHAKSVIVKIL